MNKNRPSSGRTTPRIKLSLQRASLRVLARDDLARAAGGVEISAVDTVDDRHNVVPQGCFRNVA